MSENTERNYYVLCDDNCRFPAMTAEQVIEAIAEATGNVPEHLDDAFITKLKEQNAGNNMKVWVGTQAQYNAISTPANDTLYIITDVNTSADLDNYTLKSDFLPVAENVEEINEEIAGINEDLTGLYSDLFYKAGDEILSGTIPVAGVITSGQTQAVFTYPIFKSLKNINSATVISFKGGVRYTTGGYLENLNENDEWVGHSGLTITASINKVANAIKIAVAKSSKFDPVPPNNTPLVGNISVRIALS